MTSLLKIAKLNVNARVRLACFFPLLCFVAAGQEADLPITGWLYVEQATVGSRFVYADAGTGEVNAKQAQHQQAYGLGVTFDREGKYSLHTLAATGGDFSGGWNDLPGGRAPGSGRLFWKQMYFSAKPVDGVEFSYGGIGVERGGASPVAGYSEDGYLTGERLRIRRPQQFFFDDAVITYGYLGDFQTPDMNRRFHRLQQVNFRQYLVSKRLTSNITSVFDYSDHEGRKTVRESVRMKLSQRTGLDSLRLEFYQRRNGPSGSGYVAASEKRFGTRLQTEFGYASVDRNFGNRNADAFYQGRRVYAAATWLIRPELSVSFLANRAAGNNYVVPNRTHFHCGFSYDLIKGLRRAGRS